ncbi:hypothetical protein CI109_103663 [Kwoniella shandongensis]|uniref:Uncharacterized protein n=1 Tax=Kwoniella shandongensis TaxID=1734106 RepID=A0A5M6CBB2_9TREE|nr:uncharacterized protein CI109_000644 [Kwoniella shandongensis]KAA5531072.1 hypothetical protein CI109_000644 [Kwoniella shandongensis]
MARPHHLEPGDSESGRESSADPLDVISHQPQSAPESDELDIISPSRSTGEPSRKKRPASTSTSRSSSIPKRGRTSPKKSRGISQSKSRSRSSASRSASPVKRLAASQAHTVSRVLEGVVKQRKGWETPGEEAESGDDEQGEKQDGDLESDADVAVAQSNILIADGEPPVAKTGSKSQQGDTSSPTGASESPLVNRSAAPAEDMDIDRSSQAAGSLPSDVLNIIPSATVGPIDAASTDSVAAVKPPSPTTLEAGIKHPRDEDRLHSPHYATGESERNAGQTDVVAEEGRDIEATKDEMMEVDATQTKRDNLEHHELTIAEPVESEGEVEIDHISNHDEGHDTTSHPGHHTVDSTPAPTSEAPSPQPSASAAPKSKSVATGGGKSKGSTSGKAQIKKAATGGKKNALGGSASSSGPKKGKGKTKVEELKGTKARSTSVSESQASLDVSEASSGGDPNAVYCVCRKPYDEEDEDEGIMIGCESCDNWFHPPCVGLSEEMVDLLDVYICKSCERSTAQRTVYKKVCKRDGCKKSVAGSASKFCSSSCAFRHSHSVISGMTNKNTLKQLAKTFIAYPQPDLGVVVVHHDTSTSKTAKLEATDTEASQLALVQKQIEEVQRAMDVVRKRQAILEAAIERCETLAPVQPTGEEDEDEDQGKTKGKGKKGRSGGGGAGKGEDEPCGWDRRLVSSDEEVEGMADDVEGQPCMVGRRKCDRHQGWQKTTAVSLEVEIAGLSRIRDNLTDHLERVKSSDEGRKASEQIRTGFMEKRDALKGGGA